MKTNKLKQLENELKDILIKYSGKEYIIKGDGKKKFINNYIDIDISKNPNYMFIKVGFTNTPLTPKKSNVIYNDILEYLISIEFKFKDIRIDIENLTKYSFDDEDCKAQIRGIKTTQLLNSI